MPNPAYDPAKAHEYYMRTRELQGREAGSAPELKGGRTPKAPPPEKDRQKARAAAEATVKALNVKLAKLRDALAARKKTAAPAADKPETSSDKIKKKQANEEYYDKNKKAIAQDRKVESRSKPAASSSGSTDTQSVEELETAIRNTLTQLKAAIAKLKAL